MEDERTTEPAPPSPSEGERAEAEEEDSSPQNAPADQANDPETEEDGESETDESASAAPEPEPATERSITDELPRTTTTGDDEQDVRSAGDGAVSGPPGDDLDDSTQRHD